MANQLGSVLTNVAMLSNTIIPLWGKTKSANCWCVDPTHTFDHHLVRETVVPKDKFLCLTPRCHRALVHKMHPQQHHRHNLPQQSFFATVCVPGYAHCRECYNWFVSIDQRPLVGDNRRLTANLQILVRLL